MPRYIVERAFPEGLDLPTNEAGDRLCRTIVNTNAEEGVTWVHSYVSRDRSLSFCVYDAPSPEAIREVGKRNQLPVGSITEVSVLDPYFYMGVSQSGKESSARVRLRAPWLPFSYLAATTALNILKHLAMRLRGVAGAEPAENVHFPSKYGPV